MNHTIPKAIAIASAVAVVAIVMSLIPARTIEAVQAEEEPVEEVSEVEVEEVGWTTERIKEAIREAFPEEPERMVLVAKCESTFRHWVNNPDTNDHGLFQLNERWHGAELKRLGLDPYDVEDNIAYARILYDKNHLRDWSASKHCWNR